MESTEHRHITHEDRGQNEQRNDNVSYQPMGVPLTNDEIKDMIEQQQGYYDDVGFLILGDGSFIDPYGYKFDEEGYDEFGGYYDDDGYYVPGAEFEEEYYGKYEEESYIQETDI